MKCIIDAGGRVGTWRGRQVWGKNPTRIIIIVCKSALYKQAYSWCLPAHWFSVRYVWSEHVHFGLKFSSSPAVKFDFPAHPIANYGNCCNALLRSFSLYKIVSTFDTIKIFKWKYIKPTYLNHRNNLLGALLILISPQLSAAVAAFHCCPSCFRLK